MMAFFFTILTLALLSFGLIAVRIEKSKKINARIALIHGHDGLEDEDGTATVVKESLYDRLVGPKMNQFRRSFNRSSKGGSAEKIQMKIRQAGSPKGMSAFDFRILQVVLLVLLASVSFLLLLLGKVSAGTGFMMIFGSLILGWSFPHLYLKSKIDARAKKALKELPDFVDLLAVSMEAGLGFDQALSNVVDKKEGVLSEEFHRCLEELRLGKTRREALSSIRERLNVNDIKTIIGNIIQAEQLGVGMVQILRIQSNEVRERRKQRAEEQAMKAPIKMLFPLVLFIFPCIFIVLLGPVLLNLMETFK
jgi:tight adherence protein C